MRKYLLADSFIVYLREKFPYDVYTDDFELIVQSIKKNESYIVNETKRNLNYLLQEENDIDYYSGLFKEDYSPTNKTLQKMYEIINHDKNFTFLQHEVLYGQPISIPFIIATAMIDNSIIVLDETDKEFHKYKKLCETYNIEMCYKTTYLKALKGKKN